MRITQPFELLELQATIKDEKGPLLRAEGHSSRPFELCHQLEERHVLRLNVKSKNALEPGIFVAMNVERNVAALRIFNEDHRHIRVCVLDSVDVGRQIGN